MTPETIVERMQVKHDARIYMVGCNESRVTLYAQQVRALNLAWALKALKRIGPDSRVVIIGAGTAGLTAALAFGAKGARVSVVERNEVILPRFRGNTQRYLHPHAFDWPNAGATELEAGLPIMNWKAGLASSVAEQLGRAWTVEQTYCKSVELYLGAQAKEINPVKRVVKCEGLEVNLIPYDLLVFAVGVGTERTRFGTPTYWENDSLAQLYSSASDSVLISGNGDGALVDVIRASLVDFDHARLMIQVLSSSQAYSLRDSVAEIEQQALKDRAFDLDKAYSALDLSRVLEFVRGRVRKRRKVTLNLAEEHLFRRDTMPLNRVLVECLRRLGLEIWRGRVTKASRSNNGILVTLLDGTERIFDSAVFRHGPVNDLAAEFPEFAQGNCDLSLADPTRIPLWPREYFSLQRPKDSLDLRPSSYDIVELDEGFGLESRAWSMNERGVVVGWTQLPRSADHAAFIWSGSGLPPELGNMPGIEKTAATDINIHGDYVVSTEGGSGQGWLISDAALTVLNGFGPRSMPYSINDNKEVVGWCDDERGWCKPCIWLNGQPELLEDCGLGGVALQINNNGTIVGEVRIDSDGKLAAARWSRGSLELFWPPGPYSSARAFRVNNHGLTVGYLMHQGLSDFFIWPLDAKPVIIGQGEAYGVNDSGWVVGRAGAKGSFLYREGAMLWLDDLVGNDWRVTWPFCLINDLRIVGQGRRFGIDRAILLVPRFK